jgi:hypothetical protein
MSFPSLCFGVFVILSLRCDCDCDSSRRIVSVRESECVLVISGMYVQSDPPKGCSFCFKLRANKSVRVCLQRCKFSIRRGQVSAIPSIRRYVKFVVVKCLASRMLVSVQNVCGQYVIASQGL